jgi:hypothetical protein
MTLTRRRPSMIWLLPGGAEGSHAHLESRCTYLGIGECLGPDRPPVRRALAKRCPEFLVLRLLRGLSKDVSTFTGKLLAYLNSLVYFSETRLC